MADLSALQSQISQLQSAVDAEQAQIAKLLEGQETTISSLNEQIANLQALVDAAPTPAQLQEIVSGLETVRADIESTVEESSTDTTTTEASVEETTTEAPVEEV